MNNNLLLIKLLQQKLQLQQQQQRIAKFHCLMQLQHPTVVQGPHVLLQQQLLMHQLGLQREGSKTEQKILSIKIEPKTSICVKQEEREKPSVADEPQLTKASVTKKRRKPSPKERVKKYKLNKKSKYRGVYWNPKSKMWRVVKSIEGTTVHQGNFKNEQRAAQRFDLECMRLFLEQKVKNVTFNFVYRNDSDVLTLSREFPETKASKFLFQQYQNAKSLMF